MVLGCELNHVVETNEVGLVWLAQIVILVVRSVANESRKRTNAIGRCCIDIRGIIAPGAGHIDPAEGIKPVRLAVGKVKRRVVFAETSHQSLRRVAYDQERSAAPIDKITAVIAHLEWVDWRV